MDKKLVGLAVILVITIGAYFLFTFVKVPFAIFSQASQKEVPSTQSSLIFAWPLEMAADSKTESEITIFIRNDEGKGVAGESVRLTTSVGQVKEPLLSTGADGKAIFHISSSQVGVAEIKAFVDNKKLQRTISVKFK